MVHFRAIVVVVEQNVAYFRAGDGLRGCSEEEKCGEEEKCLKWGGNHLSVKNIIAS